MAKRLAKKSAKTELAELKALIKKYVLAVYARQNVVHSATPPTKKVDGKEGSAVVSIQELISVVQVATQLGKIVRLSVEGPNLAVNLVDSYPTLPQEFYNIRYED